MLVIFQEQIQRREFEPLVDVNLVAVIFHTPFLLGEFGVMTPNF